MENTTLEYSEQYNVMNTTTTPETEQINTSQIFIIMFSIFFGFICLVLICSFFLAFLSNAGNRNRDNNTCYSTTCSIMALITLDILSLLCCKWPILSIYHNDNGTGRCDEYDCKFLKYFKCCKCCNCGAISQPKLEIEEVNVVELFEVVVTQPFDKVETCVICYEELGEGTHGELKCGHKFHKKCISQWMNVSAHKNCPTCRDSQIN